MIFTVWIVTVVAFAVIQLPPGDYVTSLVSQMMAQGVNEIKPEVIEQMREQYGLNDSVPVQYLKWMRNIITKGDFGYSLTFKRDAADLIAERLPMTFLLTLSSVLFIWVVALPIGVYSAVNKYSPGDYVATFFWHDRAGSAEFSVRADHHVLQLQIYRADAERLIFNRLCDCALEFR